MAGVSRVLSKESFKTKKRVFYFFETIANSVFITITGLFFTIFLFVLSFALIFFNPISNQVVLFTLLGVISFSVSYKFFLRKNGHILRNLTYENFLVSRKKLFSWVIWTFNFYFLMCWMILIMLGSYNGFGINFPTADSKPAFIVDGDNGKMTKVLGFVLLCVHLFLLVLIKVIIHYWDKIFRFADNEFKRRRNVLENVRAKANLGR